MKNRPAIQAFTLVELLVVISIISVLSSLVLANVSNAQAKGRDSRRTQDMVQFRDALELYASGHNGQYPPITVNTPGIAPGEALTSKGTVSVTGNAKPQCGTGNSWTSANDADSAAFAANLAPYFPNLPLDPTNDANHCYIYQSTPAVSQSDPDATTAAFYDSSIETGTDSGLTEGVVVGDTSNYTTDIPGLPALADVIGVTTSTTQAPPAPPVHTLISYFTITQDNSFTPPPTRYDLNWSAPSADSCKIYDQANLSDQLIMGVIFHGVYNPYASTYGPIIGFAWGANPDSVILTCTSASLNETDSWTLYSQ